MTDKSTALWPIHYKPLPDELLSCWLVRLAHGHGMKVQTFCNAVFGNRHQVWNRDIDRLAPAWLLDEVGARTGANPDATLATTLRPYEGLLYRKFRSSGALHWMLILKLYHRKRMGFGLQFCPACLADDQVPYFRKRWRVAFYTVCTRHKIMLHDRCSRCSAAIAVHRLDIGALGFGETRLLSTCHACGFDLRKAPRVEPISYDQEASAFLMEASRILDAESHGDDRWNLGTFSVFHHLCTVMTARYEHVKMRRFVLGQLGVPDISLTGGNMLFETRPIDERHHLLQLGAWLTVDLETRLTSAWLAKVIRYNILLKDFINPPGWYVQIAKKLSNWRLII